MFPTELKRGFLHIFTPSELEILVFLIMTKGCLLDGGIDPRENKPKLKENIFADALQDQRIVKSNLRTMIARKR